MGRRGRFLKKVKDKIKHSAPIQRAKDKIKFSAPVQRAKLTKMQLAKVKKGMGIAWEIRNKIKQYEKELKKQPDKITEDKLSLLRQIFACIKTVETDKMKELAQEYDNRYPNDFGE